MREVVLSMMCAVCLCISCAKKDTPTNGESNWLKSCETDAQCGDGMRCKCGMCSVACEVNSECGNLAASAVCTKVSSTSVAASCNTKEGEDAICVIPCDEDNDCAGSLGASFVCRLGYCVDKDHALLKPEPPRDSDASTEDSWDSDIATGLLGEPCDIDGECADDLVCNASGICESPAGDDGSASRDAGDAERPDASGECVPDRMMDIMDTNAYNPIDSIEELHQFAGYAATRGDLIISDTEISDLEDLHCLTRVAGAMSIRRNQQLMSLDGLRSVVQVGWHITIYDNDTLTDIDGLSSVSSVGRDGELNYLNPHGIRIGENDSLQNLNGLANLDYLYGDLMIANNIKLPTCEAEALMTRLKNNGWEGTAIICGNLSDECGSETCPSDLY